MSAATTPAEQARTKLLEALAKKHLGVETLETRSSDSLDFHDVSVWGIKAALEDAFFAGCSFKG